MLAHSSAVLGVADLVTNALLEHHIPLLALLSVTLAVADVLLLHWRKHRRIYVGDAQ